MSVDFIVIDICLFLVVLTFNVVITEQGEVIAVGVVVRFGAEYLNEFILFLLTMLWFWW